MNRGFVLIAMLLAPLTLTACREETKSQAASPSSATPPASSSTNIPQLTPPQSAGGQPTTAALAKGALACPPSAPLAPNVPLAARVNGIGIPLDLYNHQVEQAQTAMIQQGLDPKSSAGQEALKSLRQQVLDQLINDVVIAQQAEKEGVKFTDDELNARLAQIVQDEGGAPKLNEYLSRFQITLGDLCAQLRAHMAGEAMLNRVTAPLPTNVEQVHARHILVPNAALAQTVLAQIRQGKDFATLAKQYSVDEASKANGGDLGWFPKGVMDPQFETMAFQLKPGQVSDVVQTQFGYHIIKVEEHENARALSSELIQNARQQAFFAWLQAVRDTMKIERLVQP